VCFIGWKWDAEILRKGETFMVCSGFLCPQKFLLAFQSNIREWSSPISERCKPRTTGSQREGQTSSPHSALSLGPSSCLSWLTLFSPSAAEMLKVSDIQKHSLAEVGGAVKTPGLPNCLLPCWCLSTRSADTDKPFCIRSGFVWQSWTPGPWTHCCRAGL